jgi:hypothetical protein
MKVTEACPVLGKANKPAPFPRSQKQPMEATSATAYNCRVQGATTPPHTHTHTHTHTHAHTYFVRETNEPTTNVEGHEQAVARLWFENTSSGQQNRKSHVARRLSVARLGTWGAFKVFVYPLGADSCHATRLGTKLEKRGRGKIIHLLPQHRLHVASSSWRQA